MLFEERDIITVTNINFKNNGQYDWKRRRPALVIHFSEEFFYFLLLSTYNEKHHNSFRYYTLTKENCENLKVTSAIDLDYIYKKGIYGDQPKGIIALNTYQEILASLIENQYYLKRKYGFADPEFDYIHEGILAQTNPEVLNKTLTLRRESLYK